LRAFNAKLAQPVEKYLGVVILKILEAMIPHVRFLVDKSWLRLDGWKIERLSHAGRSTLIKSTMASTLVYYMIVSPLLKKTMHELSNQMRKFLWGKLNKAIYLSFIG
jgi:hypothetical protein